MLEGRDEDAIGATAQQPCEIRLAQGKLVADETEKWRKVVTFAGASGLSAALRPGVPPCKRRRHCGADSPWGP